MLIRLLPNLIPSKINTGPDIVPIVTKEILGGLPLYGTTSTLKLIIGD